MDYSIMEWYEADMCPEEFQGKTQKHLCERENEHDGSHVYTVYHMESYFWAGHEHWEAVPDHPVYWDTELRCTEDMWCEPFPVHPDAPDLATMEVWFHMVNHHSIGWLQALDSIQNEITAWKVTPV